MLDVGTRVAAIRLPRSLAKPVMAVGKGKGDQLASS